MTMQFSYEVWYEIWDAENQNLLGFQNKQSVSGMLKVCNVVKPCVGILSD